MSKQEKHKHKWQVAYTQELLGYEHFRVYLICVECGAFKSYIHGVV